MSSIYDALSKAQGDSATPMHSGPAGTVRQARRMIMAVLLAALLGGAITAAVFIVIDDGGQPTALPDETAVRAPAGAPAPTVVAMERPAPLETRAPRPASDGKALTTGALRSGGGNESAPGIPLAAAPLAVRPAPGGAAEAAAPMAAGLTLDSDALCRQARERLERGDTAGAIAAYERVVAGAPQCLEAGIGLGGLYFARAEYDKALSVCNRALAYFENDARLLNNTGSVLLAMGDASQASVYFRRAHAVAADFVEPVYNLACAYARLHNKEQALANLKEACDMHAAVRQWAVDDPDLGCLADDARFRALIGRK